MFKQALVLLIVTLTLALPANSQKKQPQPQHVQLSKNIMEANKALNESKFDEAISLYNKEIKANPKNSAAFYGRGNAYLFSYQFEKAVEDFTKVIKLNPKMTDAYNNRGLAYSYMNETQKAMDDFNKAVKLEPKYAEAYLNRGNVYMMLNNNDSAMIEFEKVIKLSPKNPSVYYQAARIHYMRGEYDEAVKKFTQAEKLRYLDHELFYQRGNANFKQKKYKEAIEDYTKMLSFDSKHVHSLNNRAVSYEQLGYKEKADADRKKISELQGFLLPPLDSIRYFKYVEPNTGMTIDLPADWNTNITTGDDKVSMVITPERFNENQSYSIGVSINREKGMQRKYNVLEPDAIAEFWESSVVKNNMNYYRYDIIKKKMYEEKNGYQSFTNTTILQYTETSQPLVFYEHVLIKQDEIIYIYLQSPQYLGEYFEKVYQKAIESITLPVL